MANDPFAALMGSRAGTSEDSAERSAAPRPADSAKAAREFLRAVAQSAPAGTSDDDVAAMAFKALMEQFESWHRTRHDAWTATQFAFAHALAGVMRDMPTLHLKTAVSAPGRNIEQALRAHLNIPVEAEPAPKPAQAAAQDVAGDTPDDAADAKRDAETESTY